MPKKGQQGSGKGSPERVVSYKTKGVPKREKKRLLISTGGKGVLGGGLWSPRIPRKGFRKGEQPVRRDRKGKLGKDVILKKPDANKNEPDREWACETGG